MKDLRLLPVLLLCALSCVAALAWAGETPTSDPIAPKDGVIQLFNGKDLSKLYTRLNDTKYEDPRKVFTVHDGLLHLSGDGFGGVITKDAYRDYHLVLEFKWGPKTWGRRETRAKDSGIMFHCTGPEDSFGGSWPEAFQAQIQQGGTGDLYAVKAEGPVPLSFVAEVEERGGKRYWKKGGERQTITRGPVFWPGKDPDWKNEKNFRGKNDVESPDGEWTRVEVICDGDHAVVKVNGVQVNEAFDLKPSAGKILVQVEGAELLIRRWELWPIGKAPELEPIGQAETSSAAPEKERWIPLFNGKDLTGWTVKIRGHELNDNYGDTFRVEDGVIKVAYDRYEEFGGKFGHIFYKDSHSRYRLRLEYRFVGEQVKGGAGWAFRNSGIMLHCQSPESMRKDQDFPVSIEVQLLGGDGTHDRSTANLCTPGTHVVMDGKLVTRHCNNSSSRTYHGDQWVRVEVEVHGGELIRHIVNGQTVLEYEKPQLDEGDADARKLIEDGDKILREGYISLQSESHSVEFRNIELLPLEE